MEIILANPRGFCAGVKRALETLAIVAKSPNTYVFNQIVHNAIVVNDFEKQGVKFVKKIDEVPSRSNLVFSAHGVAPQIREDAIQKDLKIVDATCPLVSKVHRRAIQLAKDGFIIFLIGHKGHDELIGTYGEAKKYTEHVYVIENVSDVKNFDNKTITSSKVAYLTQTTLSVDETSEIVSSLKNIFPNIHEPNASDICYATKNRQQAVKNLINKVDCLIVVGSKNSSNTKRLYELALHSSFLDGINLFWVDTFAQLDLGKFTDGNFKKIGITSGASVPEGLISEITDQFSRIFNAKIVELESSGEEEISFTLPKIDNTIV